MYRYHCDTCGKTYIGEKLAGNMTCNCRPPRQIVGTMLVKPLSAELRTLLSIAEAQKLRTELCTRWNIANKSHRTHGSNFDSNQTVVQLISNIIEPVSHQDWERVRLLIKTDYSYDIDTGKMID